MTSRTKAMTFAIAIFALGAASVAGAETPAGSGAQILVAAAGSETIDLTGLWRLDRAASDAPPPGMRGPRGGGQGGPPEGGMRGSGGPDARGADGGPPREGGRRRLPELIHITQTDAVVSVEDSVGAVLQEITTSGKAKKPAEGEEMRVGKGKWTKGALDVTREGPRGTVHELYSLADKGATLVVLTRVTGRDGEPREFKRVYRREGL